MSDVTEERKGFQQAYEAIERKKFVDAYVASFLGAHQARYYDDNGLRTVLIRKQPVEDAYRLANEAWEQLQGLTHD